MRRLSYHDGNVPVNCVVMQDALSVTTIISLYWEFRYCREQMDVTMRCVESFSYTSGPLASVAKGLHPSINDLCYKLALIVYKLDWITDSVIQRFSYVTCAHRFHWVDVLTWNVDESTQFRTFILINSHLREQIRSSRYPHIILLIHDNVMSWRPSLHYWSFVRRSMVNGGSHL